MTAEGLTATHWSQPGAAAELGAVGAALLDAMRRPGAAQKLPGFHVDAADLADAVDSPMQVIQQAVRAAMDAELARLEAELDALCAAGAKLDDLVVVLPPPGSRLPARVARRCDVDGL